MSERTLTASASGTHETTNEGASIMDVERRKALMSAVDASACSLACTFVYTNVVRDSSGSTA